jgi:hypothetical protein
MTDLLNAVILVSQKGKTGEEVVQLQGSAMRALIRAFLLPDSCDLHQHVTVKGTTRSSIIRYFKTGHHLHVNHRFVSPRVSSTNNLGFYEIWY